jgi:PAS domain S-box-containing protein
MSDHVLVVGNERAADSDEPSRSRSENRYRLLTRVLESFATTLDLDEVLRRIATVTLEEFKADRVLLIHPIADGAKSATARFAINSAAAPVRIETGATVGLTPPLMRRALDATSPIVVRDGDADANPDGLRVFGIHSALFQILRPAGDDPWAFGMHQCSPRDWTADEIDVFGEIARYATLALNNSLIHDRAVRDMAKAAIVLDQIPDAAIIFDSKGVIERVNAVAKREWGEMPGITAEQRAGTLAFRALDGTPVPSENLPSMRALRGEAVHGDFLARDPKSSADRVVDIQSTPIRDDRAAIVGALLLVRDITDERQTAERESWRRRRADGLANLSIEMAPGQASFDDLSDAARRIAKAIGGTVRIYFYHSTTGSLDLVGFAGTPQTERFREYFQRHPYRVGEGLAGTVFQIGRPLFFYDIKGDAVIDFARDQQEREIKRGLNEQSLIAAPIEAYGERRGAIVLSQSEADRNFDAEDLEFAQAVAERIGAASHISQLTRVSLDGHRAAEELARREVDARVRFEAVIETAPVGIAVVSADELRFEMINARWVDYASQFGKISPDTRLIGLRADEVIPDFEIVLKQVADTGETRIDEAIETIGNRGKRYVNRIISPVRGRFSGITQSITVLIQDVTEQVTEDRQSREREARRRRHAECLANIGLQAVTLQSSLENLDEPSKRIAEAIGGSAMIYFYHAQSGELQVVGWHGKPAIGAFRDYISRNPYHPGEGIPGTVFQIGRPLLFSDVRGNAVVDYGRDDGEKRLIAGMNEQSLIASPIESYGDRIGVIVVARSEDNRNFDAEDLEFVQSVADRLGAASHIHQLTRMSLEGHRAAEELARREVDARVRFEAVLETAPIGVASVSADELRFELANARWLDFAEYFGKINPDTRVIGLRVAEVIPGWEKTLKQVAESGEMRFDEAVQIAWTPAPIFVNRIISAVRGRFSGITQSLTILIQDVTDQVVAKREIEALAQMMAERSARLDSILGSMTDALWVYDANGGVVDVNQAALTMFGLGSRTEAVEAGAFERFQLRYPDGRAIPRDDLPYARALRGMTVPDYLAVGRHLISGKDLDLSIAAAPIESNGVVGAVLVMRDITALQELDRKKDEFLSVASHELRTPLTTIKGYTQLLAQTIDDLNTTDRSTYLNAVLGEIERMMGLITELLDVSRIETNRLQIDPQPVRWREFLERRASAFRVQNPARKIVFEADSGEAVLSVDPDRMRQVIDNLLSNAIKYSGDQSDVEIRATVVDRHMLTQVIDRGIGIPKDEIPRLFERFHRARNVSSRYYGGLGLGLYIAKAIVESHNGSIGVVSEEGQGATFTVKLPLPA